MNPRKYLLVFALAFWMSIAGISGCCAQSQRDKPISAAELQQIIQSENQSEIVRAMNRVKQNQESHDLMIFVTKLWINDKRASPEVPWHVVNSDRIRIEIANILAQASNNGFVRVDREDLRKYAKQIILGSDQAAKGIAVSTLGLLKNSADLELIKKVALEENPQTFWAATVALSQSCDSIAGAMFADVKSRVRTNESKKFLQDSASSLSSYKQGCAAR